VRSRLDRIEDLLKDLRDASAAHPHGGGAIGGPSASSSGHPGAGHYLPPININGRSSSAVPSSVSPRPAAIQPLRLSFSGSNASDGGRGGGGGGEGEDDDDDDGQMGTMSGGRFYGPSAMSSVSSSRMNKILQDVRARPGLVPAFAAPCCAPRLIDPARPSPSRTPSVPDNLNRNCLALAPSALTDTPLPPNFGIQCWADPVLRPAPALSAGLAPAQVRKRDGHPRRERHLDGKHHQLARQAARARRP